MYYASIAPPKDDEIEFMKDLTDRCNVSRNSRTIGFVEFPNLSLEDFKNRIKHSSNSFVLNYGFPIGFITCYSHWDLENIDGFDIIKEQLSNETNYLYIDQVVIDEPYRNKALALRLFDFTESISTLDDAYSSFFAVTSHYPFNHKVSKRLLSRYDFQLRNEFEIDGMTFGMYKKKLRGWG